DFTSRNHALNAANDHISKPGRAALAAAEHLDAHHFLGARIIRHAKAGFHLNHRCNSLRCNSFAVDPAPGSPGARAIHSTASFKPQLRAPPQPPTWRHGRAFYVRPAKPPGPPPDCGEPRALTPNA